MNLVPPNLSLTNPGSLVFVLPKSLCAPSFLHFLRGAYPTLVAHVFVGSLASLVTDAFLVILLRQQLPPALHWPLSLAFHWQPLALV